MESNLLLKESFKIFGLEIHFYSLFIILGILAGTALSMLMAKRRGLNSEMIINILIGVIPGLIIGARLYYVAFSFSSFKGETFFQTLKNIIDIRQGGLAVYGGIIGGATGGILAVIICKRPAREILDYLDCIAPMIILGQAIGRVGCLFAGCCYGRPTARTNFPLAIYVKTEGAYCLATQFYETCWDLLGFIILFCFAWFYKNKQKGLVICAYLVYYGIGRAIIEGFRGDSLYLGRIRVSQLLSIILVTVGIGLFILSIILYKEKEKKNE